MEPCDGVGKGPGMPHAKRWNGITQPLAECRMNVGCKKTGFCTVVSPTMEAYRRFTSLPSS